MVDEVSAREAWQALGKHEDAVLVDVRTHAEWNFVGVPDLGALDKEVQLVAWQHFPSGAVDRDFLTRLGEIAAPGAGRVYFICRSGARSLAAAQAAADAGYDAVNVGDGFEGPLDRERHRGTVAGWKQAGLPWRQG